MKFWLYLLALSLTSSWLQAATTLASYSGGVNPTTQTWKASNATNSNATGTSVMEDGRAVWKISDPSGVAPLTQPNNSFYYSLGYTSDQIATYNSSGWDLTFSMKVPDLEEAPGGEWFRDSNAMVGIYWINPLVANQRISFAIQTGRNGSGETLVSFTGISAVQTLTATFHEYKMSYRAGVVTYYIDDQIIGTSTGSVVTTTSVANLLYWGDNNNIAIAAERGERVTYFESVSFTQVPEPSMLGLSVLGLSALLFRRRRSGK